MRHQLITKRRKTAADLEEEARNKARIVERRKIEEAAVEAKKESGKPKDDTRTELQDLDKELDKIIDATNLL